ncbi:hypothetical protein PPERSA_02733 [Pseudocohnilembus persalinus]|uniref:Uncharacterized protein n=1 Tax=Pseudocohnilembus persalinus TaxID=266149 RepID=A0A0V0R753_PSEPJ|nr:hypothetical protein PPERSA_02733 [Pseudocohnilembus persalinus]|eukprot:KRX10316.1 hypothetical protein PPERSA_02733 [Pseudocohnilembus persalinus]
MQNNHKKNNTFKLTGCGIFIWLYLEDDTDKQNNQQPELSFILFSQKLKGKTYYQDDQLWSDSIGKNLFDDNANLLTGIVQNLKISSCNIFSFSENTVKRNINFVQIGNYMMGNLIIELEHIEDLQNISQNFETNSQRFFNYSQQHRHVDKNWKNQMKFEKMAFLNINKDMLDVGITNNQYLFQHFFVKNPSLYQLPQQSYDDKDKMQEEYKEKQNNLQQIQNQDSYKQENIKIELRERTTIIYNLLFTEIFKDFENFLKQQKNILKLQKFQEPQETIYFGKNHKFLKNLYYYDIIEQNS